MLFGTTSHAQMLLVEAGPQDPQLVLFNPAFIARNGVKSVAGQQWKKADGRPMVAMDRYYAYRFTRDGKLDYSNNSFGHPGSGVDTASVIYTYDGEGRLQEALHNDLHGYYALRRTYDEEGREAHVEHVRIENLSTDRYRLVEGAHTRISAESFRYQWLNDTTLHKTWLNDQGRPYQEELFNYNALGYLTEISRRNLITQQRARSLFQYNAKGRLEEWSNQPDLAKQHWNNWRWTYDDAGNPLTRDLFQDGIQVEHSEYLYADGTLFLKAVLTKHLGSGLIDIVRFETAR